MWQYRHTEQRVFNKRYFGLTEDFGEKIKASDFLHLIYVVKIFSWNICRVGVTSIKTNVRTNFKAWLISIIISSIFLQVYTSMGIFIKQNSIYKRTHLWYRFAS